MEAPSDHDYANGRSQNSQQTLKTEQLNQEAETCTAKRPGKRIIVSFLVAAIIVMMIVLMASVTKNKVSSEPQPPSSCLPILTLPSQPWIQNGTWEYLFSDKEETWNGSLKICACLVASLVTLETPEERAFIEDAQILQETWIDLRRENITQPWKYSDGTTFDNRFRIFNEEGLCAYWNVHHISSTTCDRTRHYVCRKASRQDPLNIRSRPTSLGNPVLDEGAILPTGRGREKEAG